MIEAANNRLTTFKLIAITAIRVTLTHLIVPFLASAHPVPFMSHRLHSRAGHELPRTDFHHDWSPETVVVRMTLSTSLASHCSRDQLRTLLSSLSHRN